MRRVSAVIAAVVCSIVGFSGAASANTDPYLRPTVTVASSVVDVETPVVATAEQFCFNKLIKFTISGPSGKFTSPPVLTDAEGHATYTFPANKTKKPGRYTIVAKQRPVYGRSCNFTARTTVKVKKTSCVPTQPTFASRGSGHHCYYGYSENSLGSGSLVDGDPIVASSANGAAAGVSGGSDVVGSGGVTAQVLGAELAADPSAASGAILPVTGSNPAPVTQIAAVTVAAGLAMMLVAGFRRRTNTSVRPAP